MNTSHYFRSTHRSGFSLLEVIVAVAIFAMLSATILFNYGQFNNRLGLEQQAHEVAHWVRTAQAYALGVRGESAAGTLFPSYGVHAERATPSTVVFFADIDGDQLYTPGGACGGAGVECKQVVTLRDGARITALCGDDPAGGSPSADCGTFDTTDIVDVVFERPNPDAVLTGTIGAATSTLVTTRIILTSPRGYSRFVEIWTTGQISVR